MYYVAFVSVSHSGNEAPEMCPCCVLSVCVFQWVTCQMWSVLLQKKKKKKRNEGGPASSKEDSVQRGGTDSISFVGAMKWW